MSVAVPPCQNACPTHTNVAEYIRLILEGDFYGAWKVNRVANVFPSICGRVCVHYCEGACKRQYIKPRDGEKFSHEPVAIETRSVGHQFNYLLQQKKIKPPFIY